MGKIAFVFAGQGAQYTGMGQELAAASPAAKKVFDMADSLRAGTSAQCFTAPKEELSVTKNTQPCLFCVDLAAAESLKEKGIIPDAVAGFSLGEIAALAFARAYTYEDGFKIVCERAALMQKAAETADSAMAAVLKLSAEAVEALCKNYEKVYPVNYNCPGQLVVAGEKQALSNFIKAAEAAGAKVIPLAVSGGFHSPFMKEASEGLLKALQNYPIKSPAMPTYSNHTAKPYDGNIKELMAKQMQSPVLWQKTIENLLAKGFDTFIEVGAGKTLSGLIKKIAPEAIIYNVENAESLNNTLQSLQKGDKSC